MFSYIRVVKLSLDSNRHSNTPNVQNVVSGGNAAETGKDRMVGQVESLNQTPMTLRLW